MKERLVGEIYNKSYIAIPIAESPLFRWIQSINGNKAFYHVTIFFLGNINDQGLSKVKATLSSIGSDNNNLLITPNGLGFVGTNKDSFVLKINKTEKLMKLRKLFEDSFPKNLADNCTFLPHITIERANRGQFNKYDTGRLLNIKDLSGILAAYEAHSVGLYYRTGEGATALLFSKRL